MISKKLQFNHMITRNVMKN